MNNIVTSKEMILFESRKIVMERGISAINMRTVANACGVAVGSIYNYFPSKTELITATVEDVWKDIFHMSGDTFEFLNFKDCLLWLFESINKGCKKYPGFFNLHSMSFASEDKVKGRQMMEHYFGHIKQSLLYVLEHDTNVRSNAFNDILTADEFVNLIFTTFTSMLLQRQEHCKALLEMVSRCIY
ncbi:TetR/AcrR family transcriptional regulator [Lachnoclostridium sp.]|nr:TetR/AcrR family transcriptional regulator [Lachnoclostridium sp.]